MMAALLSKKAHGTIIGMERDWRSPALLMPIPPEIFLPSSAMCFLNEEIEHKSQSTIGWLGGSCDFK